MRCGETRTSETSDGDDDDDDDEMRWEFGAVTPCVQALMGVGGWG